MVLGCREMGIYDSYELCYGALFSRRDALSASRKWRVYEIDILLRQTACPVSESANWQCARSATP